MSLLLLVSIWVLIPVGGATNGLQGGENDIGTGSDFRLETGFPDDGIRGTLELYDIPNPDLVHEAVDLMDDMGMNMGKAEANQNVDLCGPKESIMAKHYAGRDCSGGTDRKIQRTGSLVDGSQFFSPEVLGLRSDARSEQYELNGGDQDNGRYQEPAPDGTFRDFHPSCDLNGDGFNDMVAHDWSLASAKSDIRAVSGKSGETLWAHDNMQYSFAPPIFQPSWIYSAPQRAGDPLPSFPFASPPVVQTMPDLTGDGICDSIAYGFNWNLVILAQPGVFLAFGDFVGNLKMINGATGEAEWMLPFSSSYTHVVIADPLGNILMESYELVGFPTGLASYENSDDSRFAFKTTDIEWRYVAPAGTVSIEEHIQLGDALSGDEIWNRTIENQGFVATWLTGMADMVGDGDPDVVLDDSEMNVRVLYGDPDRGGEDYYVMNYFNERQTGDLSIEEEDCRAFGMRRAYLVGDLTENGLPDIVGQYFSGPCNPPPFTEDNAPASPQAMFRTHLTPVNGNRGTPLWPGMDTQIQGWGFATDLNVEGGESTPLLAMGTVDSLFGAVAGGRLIEMEVRIVVYDTKTGSPEWNYLESTAIDDLVALESALRHFQSEFAPMDYSGDGVRDILTPPIYRPPVSQSLIALSDHDYLIIESSSGNTLSEFTAWGMLSIVVDCEDTNNEITLVSGHARRTDVTKLDTKTGEVLWRVPVYNNPIHVAQTAGRSMLYMVPACVPVDEDHAMVTLNTGVDSYQRGYEVVKVLSSIYEGNATTRWVDPDMPWVPSLEWHGGDLMIQSTGMPTVTQSLITILPIVPGVILGGAWALLKNRKIKGGIS